MNEVAIDAVGHLLVVSIKIESIAFEQTLTESLDVLTHVMKRDTIGEIRHIEGFGHLLVRYSPLLVEHCQHGAQEDETAARIKDLMSIGDEMRDDGEFPLVGEVGWNHGDRSMILDRIKRPLTFAPDYR